MRSPARSSLTLAALFALVPGGLSADGFGVYEHGARASGMAGAWVARVMDPSAIYYNVAGLSQLGGTQLYVGASLVVNSGNGVTLFDGSEFPADETVTPVPHVYLTHELSSQFTAGIGVFAPYGLGSGWDEETFPGRFQSYDADLQTVYVQPTASFAPVESFAIGAGVDFVYATVGLKRHADLSTLVLTDLGTTFGQLSGIPPNTVSFLDTELDANGTGVGYNLGLLFSPTPAIQFGVAYRSQVTVEFDGDAQFTQVPTGIVLQAGQLPGVPAGTPLDNVLRARLPANQASRTEITMPDQLVGGVSFAPTERWMVNLDVKWTDWDDFDTLVLDFDNDDLDETLEPAYESSVGWRIGGEYMLSRAWALRGGYIRDETPAPQLFVNPLLPDADRNDVSLGLGYSTGFWQFDAYWLGVFLEDREGLVGAEDELLDGTYQTTAHLLGLDVGYRF